MKNRPILRLKFPAESKAPKQVEQPVAPHKGMHITPSKAAIKAMRRAKRARDFEDLQAHFSIFRACANTPKTPLKIGIDRDILAAGMTFRDGSPITKGRLRRALQWYCSDADYHRSMTASLVRYGLDGLPAGEITDKERAHHAEQFDRLDRRG